MSDGLLGIGGGFSFKALLLLTVFLRLLTYVEFPPYPCPS